MRLLTTAQMKKYVVPTPAKKASNRNGSTSIIMSHLVNLIRTSYRKHRAAASKRSVLLKWRDAEGRADEVEDSYGSVVAQLQTDIDREFEIVDKLCDDYEAVRDKGYFLLYLAVLDQLADRHTLQAAGPPPCAIHFPAQPTARQNAESAARLNRARWHNGRHRLQLQTIAEDWTRANEKLQEVQRRATDLHADSEDEMSRLEDIRTDCADSWNVLNGQEMDLEEKGQFANALALARLTLISPHRTGTHRPDDDLPEGDGDDVIGCDPQVSSVRPLTNSC